MGIFLNDFVISIQESQNRLNLSPNPDFMFLMQMRGPLSTHSPFSCRPIPLAVYCGSGGGRKNSETQYPCLASTIICPMVDHHLDIWASPYKAAPLSELRELVAP